MAELYTAILNSQSPRYADWFRILGNDRVPLVSPAKVHACLGEDHDIEVYAVDLAKLTTEQRGRLVQFVAGKFGIAPALVQEQLAGAGFPIRAVDVTIGLAMRAFL